MIHLKGPSSGGSGACGDGWEEYRFGAAGSVRRIKTAGGEISQGFSGFVSGRQSRFGQQPLSAFQIEKQLTRSLRQYADFETVQDFVR